MTTVKLTQPAKAPPAYSTGRRIWTMTALILSILVLVLAVGAIAGTWVGRSAAIDTVTELMTGIDQLATRGREGIGQVDTLIVDVREVVGTVQAAADRASENVADRGVLLTLLPEDNARELEALADRIRTTLESILSVVQAAADLAEAIGNLPFVDLPSPEEVGRVQQEVQAIIAGVDQLVADINQFREDTAAEIARVAETANQIDARLDTTQQNLAALDSQLLAIQLRANHIRERFPLWATVSAILSTAILLWVSYAMVQLTRAYWLEWQGPKKLAAATIESPPVAEPPPAPAPEPLEVATADLPAQSGDAEIAASLDERLDESREKPGDEEE